MWPNPQFSEDLVTFAKKILNGKLHFLCSNTYFSFQDKEIGRILSQGCKGVSETFMNWPDYYIVGGLAKNRVGNFE